MMAARHQGLAMEPAGPAAGPAPKEGAAAEDKSRAKKRTGTSKYDFVKVKVWLGENMDHYYVLSRFLISRMLTVTKIPAIKATKIALEVKKYLVDNDMLDVTQVEFETVLFSIMWSKGFNQQYVDCYKMVTQFYQQRQPLVIMVCGTAWTGKSTIAQQLANRVNIPNVMQTDVIYELLHGLEDTPLHETPLWARKGLSGEALVQEFRRECRVVRKGMDGDLIKTLSDGKPIIMEGLHMDPGLYIQEFSRMGIIMLPARPRTSSPFIRGGSPQGTPRYKRSSSTGRTVSSARHPVSPRDADGAQQQQQQQQLRRTMSAAARLAAAGTKAQPLENGRQLHTSQPGSADGTSSTGVLEEGLAGMRLSPVESSTSSADGSDYTPFAHQGRSKGSVSSSAYPVAESHARLGLEPIPEDAGRSGQQELPEPADCHASAPEVPVLKPDHQQTQQQQQQQQAQQQQQRGDSTSASSSEPAQWQPPWRVQPAQHRRTSSDDAGTPGGALSPAGISREHSTTEPVSREPSGTWLPSREHSAASSVGMPSSCAGVSAASEAAAASDGTAHGARSGGAGSSDSGSAGRVSDAVVPQVAGSSQQHQGQSQRPAASQGQGAAGPTNNGSSSGCSSGGSSSSRRRGSAVERDVGAPSPRQRPAQPQPISAVHPHFPASPAAEPAPSASALRLPPMPATTLTAPPAAVSATRPPPTSATAQQPLQPARVLHLPPRPSSGSTTPAAPASALPSLPSQHSSGTQRGSGVKPLFVPILVYMDPADHNLLADEALGSLGGAVGGASSEEERKAAVQRMRQLQDYLCAYEAQGLPVVRVQYGNFNEALDKLHEYILQCFRKIMGV